MKSHIQQLAEEVQRDPEARAVLDRARGINAPELPPSQQKRLFVPRIVKVSDQRKREQYFLKMTFIAEKTLVGTGITLKELREHKRTSYFVHVRTLVCKALKKEAQASYTMIGEFLNRDHASILNLLRKGHFA
jgi:chromosomal replication initiation ATPase DnaA